MVYNEIIAVCSQIHTKHVNTLCGQNVDSLPVQFHLPFSLTESDGAIDVIPALLSGVSRFKFEPSDRLLCLKYSVAFICTSTGSDGILGPFRPGSRLTHPTHRTAHHSAYHLTLHYVSHPLTVKPINHNNKDVCMYDNTCWTLTFPCHFLV
jgi:hypothetical protein